MSLICYRTRLNGHSAGMWRLRVEHISQIERSERHTFKTDLHIIFSFSSTLIPICSLHAWRSDRRMLFNVLRAILMDCLCLSAFNPCSPQQPLYAKPYHLYGFSPFPEPSLTTYHSHTKLALPSWPPTPLVPSTTSISVITAL